MEILSDLVNLLAGVPALVGPAFAALVIFLTSDWRLSLAALWAQYLLLGMALTRFVRPEVVLAKVLLGTFVVLILLLSARRLALGVPEESDETGPHFLWFRIGWLEGPLGLPLRMLVVLLVILAVIRLFSSYDFPLVAREIALVACWLGALGIAGLVLSGNPLRTAVSLMTILAGFDLVYSGLELSLAMVGVFGALNLLAALAFSYLTVLHGLAAGESEPNAARESPSGVGEADA